VIPFSIKETEFSSYFKKIYVVFAYNLIVKLLISHVLISLYRFYLTKNKLKISRILHKILIYLILYHMLHKDNKIKNYLHFRNI